MCFSEIDAWNAAMQDRLRGKGQKSCGLLVCGRQGTAIAWKAVFIHVISLSALVMMLHSVDALQQDYGEESEGLHIVQEYVKSH